MWEIEGNKYVLESPWGFIDPIDPMKPVYLEVPCWFCHQLCSLVSVLSAFGFLWSKVGTHSQTQTYPHFYLQFTVLQRPSNAQIKLQQFLIWNFTDLSCTKIPLLFLGNFYTCCYSMSFETQEKKNSLQITQAAKNIYFEMEIMRPGKLIYHQNRSWLLAFICLALFWSLFILKMPSVKQGLSLQDLEFTS